jgi:hypothetical protein
LEITKCTHLPWPARRMKVAIPEVAKSDGLRLTASLASAMVDVIHGLDPTPRARNQKWVFPTTGVARLSIPKW